MYTYGLISTKQESVPVNLGVIFFDYDGGDFEVKIKETALAVLEPANPRIKEELAQLGECLTELWNSIQDCSKFRDSLCAYIDDKNSTIGKYVTLRSFPYFDKNNNSQDYSGVTIRGKNYFEQYLKSLDYRAALFFCETHEGDEVLEEKRAVVYPIYSIIDKGDESGKKVCNGFIILQDGKFKVIKSGNYRWYESLGCDLTDNAYKMLVRMINIDSILCRGNYESAIFNLLHNQNCNGDEFTQLPFFEFRNMRCLYQGKEFVDLYIGQAVDMAECVKYSLTLYKGYACIADNAVQNYFHYQSILNK